jgi:hypothetical protein
MSTLNAQQIGHVLDTLVTSRKANFLNERLGLDTLEKGWSSRSLAGHTWRRSFYAGGDGGSTEFEFSTGLEPWPMVSTDGGQYFTTSPRMWGFSVICSRMEMRELSKDQAADLLKRRLDAVMFSARKRFFRRILGHASTGWTNLNTLNGVDSGFNGALEDDAVGSQTNTFAGFNKSTFATYARSQNQVADCAGAAGTTMAERLLDVGLKIDRYLANEMGGAVSGAKPVAKLSSESFKNLVKSQMARDMIIKPTTNLDEGSRLSQAVQKKMLTWGGIDYEIDYNLPVQNAGLATATKPISGYIIDPTQLGFTKRKVAQSPEAGPATMYFQSDRTGVVEVSGYDVFMKKYYVDGQFDFGPVANEGWMGLSTSAIILDAETY